MMNNVLITGATRGIGKSIASVLVQSGFNVFITGRNNELLKKVSEEIDVKGFFAIDLTSQDADKILIKKAVEVLGKIDILVNNAGEYIYSPVEKTTDEQISGMIKLNIEIPYKLIRNLVPMLKEANWGRIVNIGSISGKVGEGNASLYSMTKSAFTGLTKSLALELAEYGITVNTINPGWVETELTQNAFDESDFTQQETIDIIPQKRFIEPVEIANLVKYLISDEAKGLTGQLISLCAGLSVG